LLCFSLSPFHPRHITFHPRSHPLSGASSRFSLSILHVRGPRSVLCCVLDIPQFPLQASAFKLQLRVPNSVIRHPLLVFSFLRALHAGNHVPFRDTFPSVLIPDAPAHEVCIHPSLPTFAVLTRTRFSELSSLSRLLRKWRGSSYYRMMYDIKRHNCIGVCSMNVVCAKDAQGRRAATGRDHHCLRGSFLKGENLRYSSMLAAFTP